MRLPALHPTLFQERPCHDLPWFLLWGHLLSPMFQRHQDLCLHRLSLRLGLLPLVSCAPPSSLSVCPARDTRATLLPSSLRLGSSLAWPCRLHHGACRAGTQVRGPGVGASSCSHGGRAPASSLPPPFLRPRRPPRACPPGCVGSHPSGLSPSPLPPLPPLTGGSVLGGPGSVAPAP